MVITRIASQKGEEREYVEFLIAEAHRSFIAQRSGQWWTVYENDTRPDGLVTMFERYPLYAKAKAVASARAMAEAFVAKAGAPSVDRCGIPVQN